MSIVTKPSQDRLEAATAAAQRISEKLRDQRDARCRAKAARARPAQDGVAKMECQAASTPSLIVSPDLQEYSIAVELAIVTPAIAAEWLKANKGNRRISTSTVRRYERVMKARKWRLNGEPVIFDRDGRLVNGQQRLTACVMSGVPFATLVVRGVDPEAFETLDSGKTRTGGDVLGMDGHSNSVTLSSVAILLFRYRSGEFTGEGGRVGTELYQIRETVDANPGIHDSVQIADRLRRFCPKSIIGFCHFLFNEIDPATTKDFFGKLETGAGMASTDPVLALRNRLAENRASAAKLRNSYIVALFFKAFNYAREGKEIGRNGLRWRSTGVSPEPFPTLNP